MTPVKSLTRLLFCVQIALVVLLAFELPTNAQQPTAATAETVLFRNVRVFDGRRPALSAPSDVLIQGNKIERIASTGAIDLPNGARLIDGGGRTLMPGLIDAHSHVILGVPFNKLAGASHLYLGIVMKGTLEKMLLRGFTTVRDMGVGPDGSVAAAVDEGLVAGPRVFPSGKTISQTGGHSDARPPYMPNAMLDGVPSARDMRGLAVLVDGVPEMLAAVRENLKAGATQIKIHAGGGATSDFDPLFTAQFTDAEVRAAVEAADNWGTYVIAHAYNDKSIRRLVENGVQQIAHGHLMTDEVARLVAEKNVILQPDFAWLWADLNYSSEVGLKLENLAKVQQIQDRAVEYAALLKKHGIKVAFGTDLTGPPMRFQNKEFTLRAQYWTPAEVLLQATGNSYDAIAMSGPLNKYGKFGVIESGALADLLLINGNPIESIALMEDPERNFPVIMKDGKIYKNTLDR